MRYVKQGCIIFGITMIGELLNHLLPLPVPAGVYGFVLLLAALCMHVVKLEDVELTGNFLLDAMPMMFIPVTAGLIENLDIIKTVAVPLVVISIASTVAVMAVTGKAVELIISIVGQDRKHPGQSAGKENDR